MMLWEYNPHSRTYTGEFGRLVARIIHNGSLTNWRLFIGGIKGRRYMLMVTFPDKNTAFQAAERFCALLEDLGWKE